MKQETPQLKKDWVLGKVSFDVSHFVGRDKIIYEMNFSNMPESSITFEIIISDQQKQPENNLDTKY